MNKYTFEITILETSPQVSRVVEITDDFYVNALHILIQESFYMSYRHDYEFEINNSVYLDGRKKDLNELRQYVKQEDLKEMEKELGHASEKVYFDDTQVRIKDLKLTDNSIIEYTYDFQRYIEFEIKVIKIEKVLFSKIKLVKSSDYFLPDSFLIQHFNLILANEDKGLSEERDFLLGVQKLFSLKETNKVLKKITSQTICEVDDE